MLGGAHAVAQLQSDVERMKHDIRMNQMRAASQQRQATLQQKGSAPASPFLSHKVFPNMPPPKSRSRYRDPDDWSRYERPANYYAGDRNK